MAIYETIDRKRQEAKEFKVSKLLHSQMHIDNDLSCWTEAPSPLRPFSWTFTQPRVLSSRLYDVQREEREKMRTMYASFPFPGME